MTAPSPSAFWQVHGGDGGADHKLLGLDPRDVMPSKGAAIDAARRAAARDAAYASRLVSGAAAVDEESIRDARDNLLAASRTTEASVTQACDKPHDRRVRRLRPGGRSPLELVRGGVCGRQSGRRRRSRVLFVDRRGGAGRAGVEASRRRRDAARQGLASLEEGDAVL